jgi:hypothetical protein
MRPRRASVRRPELARTGGSARVDVVVEAPSYVPRLDSVRANSTPAGQTKSSRLAEHETQGLNKSSRHVIGRKAEPRLDAMTIAPFEIAIKDATLADLRERLLHARFADRSGRRVASPIRAPTGSTALSHLMSSFRRFRDSCSPISRPSD